MRIATVQSSITADIAANGSHMREMMRRAKEAGATLVHFPESALSGHSKSQITDWSMVDWSLLRQEVEAVAVQAAALDLWVVFGCCHRLTPPARPHNSLYVIGPDGLVVTRYDKRYCSHTETQDWYTPGRGQVELVEIAGFRVGFALCIEIQFPELFQEWAAQGADCVLLSSYSDDPMFETLARAHAALNCLWISHAIPAQCGSRLPGMLIGPDGVPIKSCVRGDVPDIVCAPLNPEDYVIALTKARPWRATARSGEAYLGKHAAGDPRSLCRQEF